MIVFNEKLNGVLQNSEVSKQYSWPSCEAVDMNGDKMIVVKSRITVYEPEDN